MTITSKDIQAVRAGKDPWGVGNQTLYDLCRRNPGHTETDVIVAKVWLIGRAYSASIERGRGNAKETSLSNDRFYTTAVPAAIRKSGLDDWLARLPAVGQDDSSAVSATLKVHGLLVRVFQRLTGLQKRSLASKYLHFHRPDLFFIHDSRASSTLRKLAIPSEAIDVPAQADPEYVRFVAAVVGLRRYVRSSFGITMTPRELDRLLLRIEARPGLAPVSR